MIFTPGISRFATAIAGAGLALGCTAQTAAPKPASDGPVTHYVAPPAFDLSSIDTKADPCNDFYKFACGNFGKNHPIPADQSSNGTLYLLSNANVEELYGIVVKAAAGGASRTPNEQKIGDYYAACMDTKAIEAKGMAPVQPLLDEIDSVGKLGIAELAGKLQRLGVSVLFSYGEMQDYKDATKVIANVDQGGLGLPERDYYLRTGAKDQEIRDQYVAHVTKMLSFGGETPQQALKDANAILAFETILAKASQDLTTRREPENVYHIESMTEFERSLGRLKFDAFLEAVHSPHVTELNVANPGYMPAMIQAVIATDMETLRAYMRYKVLTEYAGDLPARFDKESFDFYGRKLEGQPEQTPRWKRCTYSVDGSLGEALGQVWVQQYFAGDAKARTLELVGDIEAAMAKDLDQLEWMSPETKVKAKEKLHAVANKIGYPDKWRDYSSLTVSPTDVVGNGQRAAAFESDRELAKIGKPVDKLEWGMTPPTVNAYYDPSMNNINFPAGILQPPFYDPKADDAVNYGGEGAVIGHELTHGFDDQGKKFDAQGNMADWWTAEDTKKFEARTGCLVDEYGKFVAVDDVKLNGKLTLGENTADNGGLVLAFMAYMERAKKQGTDLTKKIDGYTSPQRFYIAYAQSWCDNTRDAAMRAQVLTDEHSPSHFRVDGVIVNQPDFGPAFGCKKGTPMVPKTACRVW
jgi:putative endopeptidase